MAKIEYYPLYWSAKQPVPLTKAVTRLQNVQNGPGIKGGKIGTVGIGAHLFVDWAEQDLGWVRIIKVVDYVPAPVPVAWINAQVDEVPQEREWWVDKTALMDLNADPTVKRYLLTIDPIAGNTVTEL